MDNHAYTEIQKIFSPGYELSSHDHPILQNLSNGFFKRIVTYTDQVVFILNHSTFEFDFVSENISQVLGISAKDYKAGGVKLSLDRLHPEDLNALQSVVFPEYFRCFDSLSSDQKLKMKNSFTVRFLKPDGCYIKYLQHNIPLTIENGKVVLGLVVCMDITAYKKDDRVNYKNVLIESSGKIITLSAGHCGKEKLLTDREIDILRLTANGLSEKQIADKLSLSIHTVKSHRKNMTRKASVKNSAELVKYGMANLLL